MYLGKYLLTVAVDTLRVYSYVKANDRKEGLSMSEHLMVEALVIIMQIGQPLKDFSKRLF